MTGVLVTGGTGKTGSALVELLRRNGVPVRVASRHPAAGDPGAVRFDWADPATHPAALRGMDRVFLVAPVNTVDPMPVAGPFLAEAERLGVRRVVFLGSSIVLPGAPSALELAARVRARPGWVVLRASGFMQNFLSPHPVGERIRRRGEIRTAAGDGRVGWIDARDIAAAASALLTEPGGGPGDRSGDQPGDRFGAHSGDRPDGHPGSGPGDRSGSHSGDRSGGWSGDRPGLRSGAHPCSTPGDRNDYLLTGPKALSYRDAAAIITAGTGRPVRLVPIGADEQAAAYRAAGASAEFAAVMAAVEAGLKAGREDQVSTAVLDLTGRPPRTFAEFVRDHATEWAAAGVPES